ncbi:MAG TPA: hypothetical protein VHP37_28090 [Burkholderiales bacterium]|nr:hypothetical protein [Burkholderiales bacterium]
MTEHHTDRNADVLDYHQLTAELFAAADRRSIEEVCRLLAIHIGCLEQRFGRTAVEESLIVLQTDRQSLAHIQALELGLKTLVAFLSLSIDPTDDCSSLH